MAVKSLNETTEIREVPAILDLAPAVNSLRDIWIAPTAFVDGIDFICTGREIVSVMNTHATLAQTFTIKSVADALKRVGDIGPYSLAAGEVATFIISPTGFKSGTSRVTIVMSDNTVKVAVNRIPRLTY